MTNTDPIILRCLALTGSFETGKMPPDCFSSLAGDFDGQGLSFSALQWNIGQGTLQPLLSKMFSQHAAVMSDCFGAQYEFLRNVLGFSRSVQLSFARTMQRVQLDRHIINPDWAAAFRVLGATPEWQSVAQSSVSAVFDRAMCQAVTFGLKSDRAKALLFDCAVQDGGVSELATHTVLDSRLSAWEEPQIMRAIADAVARGAVLKYVQDVLSRKMCIANGEGVVHGVHYDLAKQFGL